MYQILEDPKTMSKEEIYAEFDGKWVYVVKAVTDHGSLVEGIPVVVADTPYAGNNDRIYDKYDTTEYEIRYVVNLKHYEPFIPTLFVAEGV